MVLVLVGVGLAYSLVRENTTSVRNGSFVSEGGVQRVVEIGPGGGLNSDVMSMVDRAEDS